MYKSLILALLLTSCAASYNNSTQENNIQEFNSAQQAEFEAWKEAFKQKALKSGISKQTIEKSLKISKPIAKVIALDRKQPEHKITKEQYLRNVINDNRVYEGRRLLEENKELLAKISAKYNVEPEFILALWGLETGYGKNTGGFNILSALATLSYEGRRKDFFESELISAMLIIDQGHIEAEQMRGSWAGAMGQCQFMPSSFLAYAVDYDKDGKTDIWGNKKDVFASIANYLNTVGWSADPKVQEKALKHWNRSTYFVASVFQLAEEIKDEI